jgi:hypothetical protein
VVELRRGAPRRRAMKRGLYLAPFDELADPRLWPSSPGLLSSEVGTACSCGIGSRIRPPTAPLPTWASGSATPTISGRTERRSIHASARACWMRAWSGSADSGTARSAPSRYSARGFPSGSRRTGPIGARSDARLDGTGRSRSICPGPSSSPNSPKLFGRSVPGARIPSISSSKCRPEPTFRPGKPLAGRGCSRVSSRSPRSSRYVG